MYPENMFELIKDVVTSWQVIVVTVCIVFYLNIVFYAARYYRTPRISSIAKKITFKRKKSTEAAVSSAGPETTGIGGDSNDELGLEES